MELSTNRIKEILVPVDGSQAGMDALALACLMAKRNKGKVYAVYVVEVARTLPLDADLAPEASAGEDVLARAEEVADSLDFEITGELLQARDAGHAVVDEAIERGVEAIVLGIEHEPASAGFEWPLKGKPRPLAGDLRLGHIAEYILQVAPCDVWLIRRPAGAK